MVMFGDFTINFTINPDPRQNRYALHLAGLDISLDSLNPKTWPDAHTRGKAVIGHPYEMSYFFHHFIQAFIDTFLAWDYQTSCARTGEGVQDTGLWGITKGN
jgi:hypothetical protein